MDYGIRDHMEHSLQITSTKGTNLLTSARGKFGLWKMAEKNQNLQQNEESMEATMSFATSARMSPSSTLV